MLVGGGAAIQALVRHANSLDEQGQQTPALRAPHPLRIHQALAIMIPNHSREGLPIKRAAELSHLAAFHADIAHFHQQFGAG